MTIRAWAIVVPGSKTSEAGFVRLHESHLAVGNAFPLHELRATMPEGVDAQMTAFGLSWSWPWTGEVTCPVTGLWLHAYKTANRKARMACFLSHFRLWMHCAESGQPIIVLEDDARFSRCLEDPESVLPEPFGMVSLNDPRGATRRGDTYDIALVSQEMKRVVEVPWIDGPAIPQGLPGHSAYLLRPEFAADLIDAALAYGAWPNDALACRQRFPNRLGCSTTYYTRVSGRKSTLA